MLDGVRGHGRRGQLPAGQVESLRVDPVAASHGAAPRGNRRTPRIPGDKRSKRINLLLKLRAPDGRERRCCSPASQVGRLGRRRLADRGAERVDPRRARRRATARWSPAGPRRSSADACGISRQQAPLRVLSPGQARDLARRPRVRISRDRHHLPRPDRSPSPTPARPPPNRSPRRSPAPTRASSRSPADGCDGQALAAGESCEVNACVHPPQPVEVGAGLRASTSAVRARPRR